MGKRELLIIGAFLLVGTVAYQVTAPPPKPGERGFSLSRIFNNIKSEINSNASSARITKGGTIAVAATVAELRVTPARSVPLIVIGEKRDDIAYEMPVDSNGPDEATAKLWAGKVELLQDDLGAAIALSMYFPEEGVQRASLTLKVPARLAVRVEASNKIQVSNVAAVELKNPPGEATVSGVSGQITGSHRSGDLTITGAGAVNVSLANSRAKIRGVTGSVTVTARNGECSLLDNKGDITVSATNVELVVNAPDSAVKISGDGGQVKAIDVHQLSIDARRMLVELETSVRSGDELTIITSDEDLRVHLSEPLALSLDALSTNGSIRASDFKLEPVKAERETRVNTVIGKAGGRLVLRNMRGDIVISKRK